MHIHSFIIDEARPKLLTIEFNSRFQIPSFQILGLPAPEIQEARERIMAAFQSSGFEFPKKKIIVNLSPSSFRKWGTGHDLSIAMKILSESLEWKGQEKILAWGELGLGGSIRSIGQVAHLLELLILEQKHHPESFTLVLGRHDFIDFENLRNWRVRQGMQVPTLKRVIRACELKQVPELLNSSTDHSNDSSNFSLSSTLINPHLLPMNSFQERIITISSIGKHHTLVLGPKGVGKSESLNWFRALVSRSTPTQMWERVLYQESRGERPDFSPPLRQVHSQVKPAHLLGSFTSKGFRAGELSLAHGGILFADEFVEWPRDSKECLREPLQNRKLQITRVNGSLEVQCDLQLIATGNLCPCGGFPALFRAYGYSSQVRCRCRENEIDHYLKKLSGPILDRIDLVAIFTEQSSKEVPERSSSQMIREKVASAQLFTFDRFSEVPSRLSPGFLEASLPKSKSMEALLKDITSLRSRHKTLRFAHSIQALENSSELKEEHVFEAKTYRFMDQLIAQA
jgi:magnesium chelatase family protein